MELSERIQTHIAMFPYLAPLFREWAGDAAQLEFSLADANKALKLVEDHGLLAMVNELETALAEAKRENQRLWDRSHLLDDARKYVTALQEDDDETLQSPG